MVVLKKGISTSSLIYLSIPILDLPKILKIQFYDKYLKIKHIVAYVCGLKMCVD